MVGMSDPALFQGKHRPPIQPGKKVLNVGCGNDIVPGAVNHDKSQHRPEVDVVWNLNDLPWPWEDEEFDMVCAWSVLEHLNIDLVESGNEVWRITKPGGIWKIRLPYWKHVNSFRDPTHRWQLDITSFDLFDPRTPYGKEVRFYTPYKWKIMSKGVNLNMSSIMADLKKLEKEEW